MQKIFNEFKHIKTKKNEALCSLKDVCNHFYFINSGCLRLHQTDSNGKHIIDYFALEDSFITAVTSFMIEILSKHLLTSQTACDLLVINRNGFLKIN
ncbi:MAG: cyclic nucleotide-binding domain-containing protein [Flavobacteriaceae bacterium]